MSRPGPAVHLGGGELEIVLVWQGPCPPPREVAERADRLLAYPAPLGFAAAVNRGIEAASGELVAVVNDDAVVGAGWIAALAAALAAEPRAAAAQGINYLLPPAETAASRTAATPAETAHPTQPLPAGAPADPARIDSAGLTWNRWWQAVQIGHGEPAPALADPMDFTRSEGMMHHPGVAEPEPQTTQPAAPPPGQPTPRPGAAQSGDPTHGSHATQPQRTTLEPAGVRLGSLSDEFSPAAREVFGVSATAALYRRAALEEVAAARADESRGRRADRGAGGPGGPFDERLGSYYEDVELACRLRAAGWTALAVPAATVRHAGSATADRLGGRTRLVTGNRWLVAAWLLGRDFPLAKPRMAARDLADLARALGRGHLATAAGIAAGWGRALLRLPRWARLGPPAVDRATLRRLSAERPGRGRGAG